jgi:hypothetical protein
MDNLKYNNLIALENFSYWQSKKLYIYAVNGKIY